MKKYVTTKWLLGLVLAFATVATATADTYTYLNINNEDGTASFELADIRNITFDANDMLLNLTNGSTQRLPLASLSKMFFSTAEATGLGLVSNAETGQVRVRGNVLHVTTRGGGVVTLYDMRGAVVKQIATHEDEVQVSLEGLPRGVYLVKVGSVARKVMKQ